MSKTNIESFRLILPINKLSLDGVMVVIQSFLDYNLRACRHAMKYFDLISFLRIRLIWQYLEHKKMTAFYVEHFVIID